MGSLDLKEPKWIPLAMPDGQTTSYRNLDPEAIHATVNALAKRIQLGFPNTGLCGVCGVPLTLRRCDVQRTQR